ncbi:GTPase Era [Metallibacterium sp.]|uniref:GTPase Era n=1 Tax=Metallibacterium sp. TaxID=2940281 RepID=UPI00260C7922|nr:GTPase Era [Metallibacterium sp.]
MSANVSRCGRVALVGRPNVGKSTLLNALLGTHLSIVSPKPQTTRHRILGVCTLDAGQIAFVDTPGLHRGARRALNRSLNRAVHAAITAVDLIAHVIEAGRWTDEDAAVYVAITGERLPRVLVINKIDRQRDKSRLLPFVAKLTQDYRYDAVLYASALRGQGLDELRVQLLRRLPEGVPAFAAEDITDRSERFLAAEMVREQLMLRLGDELPYSTTVEIEQFSERADGLAEVHAVIWVERAGQRPIVIGDGGAMLKQVGSGARRAMERLFGRRVFLQTWVKVHAGWSDNEAELKRLGYTD